MNRDFFSRFLSLSGAQPSAPLPVYSGYYSGLLPTFSGFQPSSPIVVSCPVSQSERYAAAFGQLDLISGLDDNWDGYGGSQISKQVITHARALLCAQLYSHARLAPPEITPTPNGTLVIEWQGREGEAAVEIGNTRVSGVIKAENSPTMCIAGETAKLSDHLSTFIAPFLNPGGPKASAITPVEYDTAAHA